MKNLLITQILRTVLVVGAVLSPLQMSSNAFADDTTLTNTEKANALREAARDLAKSQLVRPDVADVVDITVNQPVTTSVFPLTAPVAVQTIPANTFDALSQQIQRLAAAIKALGQSKNKKKRGLTPPSMIMSDDEMNMPSGVPSITAINSTHKLKSIYGPKGPTTKSVKLILEYRLMVADNPRLKIGEVNDHTNKVTARVETVDGSLVEQFSVDKKTGVWSTIR